jgi:D-glycero-D-manno-heptose 1,7-bisphosphate phosphatase
MSLLLALGKLEIQNFHMNKAIFLDRDGVINQERKDYVKNIDEFQIFPEIANFIKNMKNRGYLIIVVTNQSVINRGLASMQDIEQIHEFLQNFLLQNETSIDDFYICPHTPHENCSCRKPKSGLFLQAIKDWNIGIKDSWLIGDSDTDIVAAKSVNCKSIKKESSVTFEKITAIIDHEHNN